jgi:polyferredoxin
MCQFSLGWKISKRQHPFLKGNYIYIYIYNIYIYINKGFARKSQLKKKENIGSIITIDYNFEDIFETVSSKSSLLIHLSVWASRSRNRGPETGVYSLVIMGRRWCCWKFPSSRWTWFFYFRPKLPSSMLPKISKLPPKDGQGFLFSP